MIVVLSARCLSRAWLAVAQAAPADTVVRVEAHESGVRLIALDGYMAAWCWVPAWHLLETAGFPAGEDTVAEPLDVVPVVEVTVCDPDNRVRDLMVYLRASTAKKDSLDVPVEVDLAATIDTDPDSLFPDFDCAAARFELGTRERVVAQLNEHRGFADWRSVAARGLAGGPGAVRRVLATANVARLAKVGQYVGGGTITLDMVDDSSTFLLWSITGEPVLAHTPTGVLSVARSYDEIATDPVVHTGVYVDEYGVAHVDGVEDDGVLRDVRGAPSSVGEAGPPVPASPTTTSEKAAERRRRAAARSRAAKGGAQ